MLRLLLALIPLALVQGATDYCDSSLCGTAQHIACNNNGAFSSNCSTSPAPRAVNFNAKQKTLIVKLHNTLRNNLASGKLTKYKPAKRMATMRWNNELATLAALNVKQCEMKHDACHNTKTFKASGQNLALFGSSGDISTTAMAKLIRDSVNAWWNEKKDASQAIMAKYPSNYSGPQIGHFTAMAQEKNTHCGCAAAFYVKDGWSYYLMACNYATTNWIGQPVYQAGTKASGCKKGANANYTGLCKLTEVYNV
ncbi:venom allergen-1-like [Drosophila kikkawai]|uniref:Venom allergen-1 n=1 Tax=Drosophila kikkawai TaxID=30033 RepID=A0A6P4HQ19_DROKI|nr:antigen 5 like allergen Cul n 1-like [Drosophila kikkawai]